MASPVKHNILYIHGFNSSPQSQKAQDTQNYLAKYFPGVGFHCPQLATNPGDAVVQLEQIMAQHNTVKADSIPTGNAQTGNTQIKWHLIGSSLGGYFSSYLAHKYQLKAVLINPAVKPFELMADYLGEQLNPYTQETYQVLPQHIDELKALEPPSPRPSSHEKNNYLVMLQTGDEVLAYQQAQDKYQHCHVIVEQGGDHSFVGYKKCLVKIINFFQLG